MYPKCIIIVFVFVLLTACGTIGKYNPEPVIANRVVREFKSSKVISVGNIQKDKTDHDLKYEGLIINYNEFTERVVNGLKSELSRMGVRITENEANKELKIQVNAIAIRQSGYEGHISRIVISGLLQAKIELGNGEKVNLEIVRASGYGGPFSSKSSRTKNVINACYKGLIKEIFEHKKIITYLNE